jgi:hypothetical protein
MSSDDVEASTSNVISSSDFIDGIIHSVVDGEFPDLSKFCPEELLQLVTNEDALDGNAEAKNDSSVIDGSSGANCSSYSIRDEPSLRDCEDNENLCRCCCASGRICQVINSDESRRTEIAASASTSGRDVFAYNCFTNEKSYQLYNVIARERGRAVFLALQLRKVMETLRIFYLQRGDLDVYSARIRQLDDLMRKWAVNLNMFDAKKPVTLYRL